MSNIPDNIKKMWEEAAGHENLKFYPGGKPREKGPIKKGAMPPHLQMPGKFAAGKMSHEMTPAEYQAYFGKPKPRT